MRVSSTITVIHISLVFVFTWLIQLLAGSVHRELFHMAIYISIASLLTLYQIREEGIQFTRTVGINTMIMLSTFILLQFLPISPLYMFVYPLLFIYPMHRIWVGLSRLNTDFLTSSIMFVVLASLIAYFMTYALELISGIVPDNIIFPLSGSSYSYVIFSFLFSLYFIYQNTTGIRRQPINIVIKERVYKLPYQIVDTITAILSIMVIVWASFLSIRDDFVNIPIYFVYTIILALPASILFARGEPIAE